MYTLADTEHARAYPVSLADRLDLDPIRAQLRRREPLARVRLPYGEQAWLATRHDDVRAVLADPRFGRAAAVRTHPRLGESGMLLMSLEPPKRDRPRTKLAKALTARRVEALRPRATEIAERLLAGMAAAGPPADLVTHFATPLPVLVACELLGVPLEDRDRFLAWSEAIVSNTSLTVEQALDRLGELREHLASLVAARRAAPADDLIGDLVQARDAEGALGEDELIMLLAGLLAAGHETAVTQIPTFVHVLLTNPAHWIGLREHPEVIPAAVEELARHVPLGTAAAFARYAVEDVALGGVLVRAGEPVLGSIVSADRDERIFARPWLLDHHREADPHLGFGHGPHHGAGAHLARLEVQVALSALVRHLPYLDLAIPEKHLRWKSGMLVRGLKELPVIW